MTPSRNPRHSFDRTHVSAWVPVPKSTPVEKLGIRYIVVTLRMSAAAGMSGAALADLFLSHGFNVQKRI